MTKPARITKAHINQLAFEIGEWLDTTVYVQYGSSTYKVPNYVTIQPGRVYKAGASVRDVYEFLRAFKLGLETQWTHDA